MKSRAFTLIELLVVISIISLLASVVLASLNSARDKSRTSAGLSFAQSLHSYLGSEAVGIWDFGEGSGLTAYDSSGRGNNGNIIDGTWTNGLKGSALDFDGVNDYMNIPQQPPFTIGPNMFTVAGMIQPSNQYSRFITPQSNGVDQWIGYDPGSQRVDVVITEIADINTRNRPSSPGSVPINKWTHFAVSINDKNIKVYINGALNAEYTETINIADWTGNWMIGQRGTNTDWYKGKIDDLRVYGAVLSAVEIHDLYAESMSEHHLADNVQ